MDDQMDDIASISDRSDDSMTSTLRRQAPGRPNSGPLESPNGSVNGPASYSEDGDVNGSYSDTTLEIIVVLPDGREEYITVDSSKQMMDLAIQLAASNKLSPTSHTLQVFNEDTGKQVDYHASQTIGSLHVTTVHLVNKKAQKSQPKPVIFSQPFEKTQRLTLNLPRNQKMVTRVNPKATLADIYKMVCDEKNLDPYKYELRHPTWPDEPLNMATPLKEYGINEIAVVSVSAPDSQPARDVSHFTPVSRITPDLDSNHSTMSRKTTTSDSTDSSYMPGMTMERKKKKVPTATLR